MPPAVPTTAPTAALRRTASRKHRAPRSRSTPCHPTRYGAVRSFAGPDRIDIFAVGRCRWPGARPARAGPRCCRPWSPALRRVSSPLNGELGLQAARPLCLGNLSEARTQRYGVVRRVAIEGPIRRPLSVRREKRMSVPCRLGALRLGQPTDGNTGGTREGLTAHLNKCPIRKGVSGKYRRTTAAAPTNDD